VGLVGFSPECVVTMVTCLSPMSLPASAVRHSAVEDDRHVDVVHWCTPIVMLRALDDRPKFAPVRVMVCAPASGPSSSLKDDTVGSAL
jgi:hypothetical protein